MASTWKFWEVAEKFRRREKKNSSPSVNQKRTSIYNITEPFFTDVRGRQFQRWASQNELSINTQEILAQDHFDSMSTVKSLTPEMVYDLHLTSEEQTKLLEAIGRFHHSEPGDTIMRMAAVHRVTSLPAIMANSFSNPPVLKKENCKERPTSCCDKELLEMTTISDKEDDERKGRDLIADIGKLNMAEVKSLLELMVFAKIINPKVHRDVLAASCENQLKERVKTLLKIADEDARGQVERQYHAQRRVKHSTRFEEGLGSWQSVRSPRGNKRVSFESVGADSYKSDSQNLSERCSGNSSPLSADKPYRSDVGVTNNVFLSDPEIFIVSHNECGGQVNPFFDDHDGRDEIPKAVLQTFGQKGRGWGKLEDATSITCTEQGEAILTDFINNKVQGFDSDGKASREVTVADMRGPWNVVMSPHQFIGVTFRGSKRFSLIDQYGDEVFSAEFEFFESPAGLAVDQVGRYIITDCGTNQVYRLTWDNGANESSVECLNSKLNFNQPRYVTVSPTGQIIVSDSGNHCIKILSQHGELEREFGQYGKRAGHFRSPYAVCCDHRGNIIVADHYNNRISMFSSKGLFIRHLLSEGHGLTRPQGLHLTRDRKLYVTHGRMKANQVLVFDLCEGADTSVSL